MGPARISIQYYEELVNHVSRNREVLARRKYTDNNTVNPKVTRDLLTLNNAQSISQSPRPLAAGPIRNAEIVYKQNVIMCAHLGPRKLCNLKALKR